MELNKYQELSKEYDQNPSKKVLNGYIIPLFGVIGESGALVTEFKKRFRDKQSHTKFRENVEEKLGNILWYASNIASKMDLTMEEVALKNLKKIKERFPKKDQIICVTELFDIKYQTHEQITREFIVEFIEVGDGTNKKLNTIVSGKSIGDPLTDNSYEDDGYRYHDIFHFSYAAVLGWSPVVRSIMKLKRKSDPLIDEVEDGARAGILEEAVSALVYQFAKNHMLYENIEKVDNHLIRTIKSIVSHLEVSICTSAEWERAILLGYEVFRELVANNGGKVSVNLNKREIKYIGK